jgi:hypothetical protein
MAPELKPRRMYALIRCFPRRGHGSKMPGRVEWLIGPGGQMLIFHTRRHLNCYCGTRGCVLYRAYRYPLTGKHEEPCPDEELFRFEHHWYEWRKIWVEETDE